MTPRKQRSGDETVETQNFVSPQGADGEGDVVGTDSKSTPTLNKKTIIIIAGEDSGDLYGAMLVSEIRKALPGCSLVGIGGYRMASEGVRLLCNVRETAVMGAVEMVDKIFFLFQKYREILHILDSEKIAGVVLIDYPDFNLRVASSAKKRDVPVFYYISPQVWAWRKWRVNTIKKCVTKMMVILPFEKQFYSNLGISVDFVGHPLLDIVKPKTSTKLLKDEFNIQEDTLVIGLLPGSRKKEVKNLLPQIAEAASRLKKKYPLVRFLLPLSPSIDKNFVLSLISHYDLPVTILDGRAYDVMAMSDILITKSGTSTLESTIIGTPMVIVYRASFFSVFLARLLVRVQFAGLPNLLAGKKIVPELLQQNMTPENIVKEVTNFLDNRDYRENVKKNLIQVRNLLGENGASKRAAKGIIDGLL